MPAAIEFPLAVQAVALDLDGTLLHTAPDLAQAANLMLQALQRPQVPEAVVMTYVGNGAARLVKRLLTGMMQGEPASDLYEPALALFFRHYAEVLCDRTTLYPGVLQGLQNLQHKGVRMVCITNKPARFTEPLLQRTGLAGYFELVLSGDSLPFKKPHPMPLLHACAELGIRPQQMVMVGDSAADVEAARAAGCYVFYVPYGYNRGVIASELDIDAKIDSLVEIDGLIRLH